MLVAVAIALVACSAGSTGGESYPADINAAQPTYFGTGSAPVDAVLTGSAIRPALTAEGQAVLVELEGGSVMATVVGPDVPGEGLPKVTDTTTCTWIVTLEAATGALPVKLDDFTASDHLGAVYKMALAPGQRTLPATIARGQSLTFSLRTIMPTGEGLMRWAPGGSDLVASWDFVVEND